uniref:Type IV pilus assembly protein PilM n=1 Tax=Candidatus Giovannonibacteria bacterium GW2011_GWF2_42_19 TaxID=1618659 RepID=A0A0G0ZHF5_9BACT|nr:MAG: hypothetical protein UV11_C0011G0013 [Candidatus Giovannonibacteria bacterium GW2011_GWF2_42_19]
MPFFKSKVSTTNILLFDIGSSSVNGFLIGAVPGKNPEILYSARSNLRLMDASSDKNPWRSVRGAMEEIVKNTKNAVKGAKPGRILAILSSPWFSSETRGAEVQRNLPFVITEKILDDVIDGEAQIFISKKERDLSLSKNELCLIESDPLAIRLNGYLVDDARGKKAEKLELALYVSAAKKEIIDGLNEIFHHFFGQVPILIGTAPLILFNVLKENLNCDDGYVLVHIGGEVTELSLIRNCILEKVETFPRGGNFIVRRIAAAFNMEIEDAASYLRANTNGEISPNQKQFEAVLDEAGKEWYNFLFKATEKLKSDTYLPQLMMFLGGASKISALKRAAESPELSAFTALGKPFNVRTLTPKDLENEIFPTSLDVKDPQLTLPLLLAIAASKNAPTK